MSSEDLIPTLSLPQRHDEKRAAEQFQKLYTINLNDKVEQKNGLTYLPWASAWAIFKTVYPDATFKVIKDTATNMPYFASDLGIIVYTEVTADGTTLSMHLPVMNASNRALKTVPYVIQSWDKKANRFVEKTIEAATMFDVNSAIARCLVKNLAMFGLGLYIYQGEDVPADLGIPDIASFTTPSPAAPSHATTPSPKPVIPSFAKPKTKRDKFAGIKAAISSAPDTESLYKLYYDHEMELAGNDEILALFSARKEELEDAA